MADIIVKNKKGAIKLDLTPMVDLGFLLITFFVLTTALTKPNTLELSMPTDKPTPTPNTVPESCTINIIPCKKGYYYYYGNAILNIKFCASIVDVRTQLIALKAQVHAKKQAGKLLPQAQAFVYVKPSTSSTYGQCVEILDELQINQISLYAMKDANLDEEKQITTDL